MEYQPKRSAKRWLEGAPKPVLACYDNGGKTYDRYTVIYGKPFWTPDMGVNVPYFGLSIDPFHPCGFGQHGEMNSVNRSRCGKKIKFSDLPEQCQKAVNLDCEGI